MSVNKKNIRIDDKTQIYEYEKDNEYILESRDYWENIKKYAVSKHLVMKHIMNIYGSSTILEYNWTYEIENHQWLEDFVIECNDIVKKLVNLEASERNKIKDQEAYEKSDIELHGLNYSGFFR